MKIILIFIFCAQELKQCFDIFDADKSGTISLNELKSVFRKLGMHMTNHDITKLMNLMDKVKL